MSFKSKYPVVGKLLEEETCEQIRCFSFAPGWKGCVFVVLKCFEEIENLQRSQLYLCVVHLLVFLLCHLLYLSRARSKSKPLSIDAFVWPLC